MNRAARRQAIRAVTAEYANQPFEYGSLDCAHFAGAVAEKITGVNYLASFMYTSEDEATELIKQHGSIANAARSVLGPATGALEDGDPCVVKLPIVGEALGFWCDGQVMVKTKGAAIKVDARLIVAGWSLNA